MISGPFSRAPAFTFAFIARLVGAGASWLRGGKCHYREDGPRAAAPEPVAAPR